MARLKFRPAEPTVALERGVKAATFRLLLRTAMDLIVRAGQVFRQAEPTPRTPIVGATQSQPNGQPAWPGCHACSLSPSSMRCPAGDRATLARIINLAKFAFDGHSNFFIDFSNEAP